MKRRRFLAGAASATSALALADSLRAEKDDPNLLVSVIGHTGRGNYGHGLDTVWKKIPDVKIIAVADANPGGLKAAKARLGADRGFAEYREMLFEVPADIIAICPRHADQHRDMAVMAARAGAKGIYIEKPFCRTPAEADEIAEACEKSGTKLAIAHRNRYHPVLPAIEKLIAEGAIGKLLEIRGRGKGDRRGGGEDLWVLGSHVLNIIHYFAGEPKSCSATMLQDGVPATKAHVREGAEGLGPLAGNELHARYQFGEGDNAITAYFDSIANDDTKSAGFGLQLVGSEGLISMHPDRDPVAHLCRGNPFDPKASPREWVPISSNGPGKPETKQDVIDGVHDHRVMAADLLNAIHEERLPLCDIKQAAMTVELICAAFSSHAEGGKAVSFPLTNRQNALASL